MKEIDKFIDEISAKFGYSEMLTNDLKRIVPLMLDGKDDEKRQMLFDTLSSVKIFVLPENSTKQDLEACRKQVFGKDNYGVTFIEADKGEYSKVEFAPGAYITEPVFDEEMNIVGRNRMLYVKELSKWDKIKEVYGSNINLSHLIHELGHAWAAEKDEYIQNEDGTFMQRIGTCSITNAVNQDTKEVRGIATDGLHIEEALNTIQEEKVLLALTGAQSVDELRVKGYVGSAYQGLQKSVMDEYVKKFGSEVFEEYRYSKDKTALADVEKALAETSAWATLNTPEYTQAKRNKMKVVDELDAPQSAISRIKGFFEEYDDVYFADNTRYTPIQKLNNVLEQLYDFNSVKYNFNILGNDKNTEIYKTVISSIMVEASAIRLQARDVTKCKQDKSMMSELKSGVQDEQHISEHYMANREASSKEDAKAPNKEEI